jgi:prevent-host-death family protein
MAHWGATQAKAKFSEVLDKAETTGPQRIERRKKRFVLLTEEQYAQSVQRLSTPNKPFVSAWDALRPTSGVLFDVDFPRLRSKLHSKPGVATF